MGEAVTRRTQAGRQPADLMRLISDLRALKNRMFMMELSRLDDERTRAIGNAVRDAEGSSGHLSASEARRYAEAECDRSREMLESRFQRLEAGLVCLEDLVKRVGSASDTKVRSRRETRVHAAEAAGPNPAAAAPTADFARLVERAKSLEEEEGNLQEKIRSYNDEMSTVMRLREELNRDFENMGKLKLEQVEERGALEARKKELDESEKELQKQVLAYNDELESLQKLREELNHDFEELGRVKAAVEAEREQLEIEKKKSGAKAGEVPIEEVIQRLSKGFEKMLRDSMK